MKDQIERFSRQIDTTPDTSEETTILLQLNEQYTNLITSTGIINRPKRFAGLLIGGGIAALSFIGGIIASTNSKITDLQKDEKVIRDAIRKNIYIVNTTVNNFQHEMARIAENEKKYDNLLLDITSRINYLTHNVTLEDITLRINTICLQFEEIATITLNQPQLLQSAILFAKQRILHPGIISSRKLRDYLAHFRTSPTQTLPLLIEADTSLREIQKYTEICTIDTEIIGANLLFAISIPLIENDNRYTLYELIPFPYFTYSPSSFNVIIPQTKYLILSVKTNRFTMMNSLEHCITITPIYHLCQLHDLAGVTNGPCEVGIRYDDFSQCQNRTQTIVAKPEVWHYLTNNRWLFTTSTQSRLTIECTDKSLFQQQLPNRGLLALPPDCVATTREFVFYPHSNVFSDQPTEFKPFFRFNFSIPSQLPSDFKPITVPRMQYFNPDHLRQLYEAQQEELDAFNEGLSQPHTWITVAGSSIVIIILLALIYILYVYHHRHPQRENTTYPAITYHHHHRSTPSPYQESENIPLPNLPESPTQPQSQHSSRPIRSPRLPSQPTRRSQRLTPHPND